MSLRSQRRRLLAGLAGLATAAHAGPANAQAGSPPPVPAELAKDWPDARLRGSASMRFLGLHVYDIQLWTPALAPAAGPAQPPLALSLVYSRTLDGAQIARRSIAEMRRIGPLSADQAATWLAAMVRLFPDVQAGDRLTGTLRADGGSRFHFNGQAQGEITDAEFCRLFFGIWLSPRTSEPSLRTQLLGLAS